MNFLSILVSPFFGSSSTTNDSTTIATTNSTSSAFQTPPRKAPRKHDDASSIPQPLPSLDNSITSFNPSRCIIHPLPIEITGSWFNHPRKPFAIVIDNILTPEECQQWIDHTENYHGYETALVNVGGGRQMEMLNYRKSSRCIIDDKEFAKQLYDRIKPFLVIDTDTAMPTGSSSAAVDATGQKEEEDEDGQAKEGRENEQTGKEKELIVIHDRIPYELNERLRFLRYDPGEYFASHMDGRYYRPIGHPHEGDFSLITCQLYLNDGFTGGTTRFFHSTKQNDFYDVIPKAGSVLLFEHRMEHSGEVVVEGCKYAMRTDIMFTIKK